MLGCAFMHPGGRDSQPDRTAIQWFGGSDGDGGVTQDVKTIKRESSSQVCTARWALEGV